MALTVTPILGWPWWTFSGTTALTSTDGAASQAAGIGSLWQITVGNYAATTTYGGSPGFTAVNAGFQGQGTQLVHTSGFANTWIAGFLDGENRAKLFYTDGSTIALPTPVTTILHLYWNGAFGVAMPAYQFGPVDLLVSFATGSTDAASPALYKLDPNALVILASTQYG